MQFVKKLFSKAALVSSGIFVLFALWQMAKPVVPLNTQDAAKILSKNYNYFEAIVKYVNEHPNSSVYLDNSNKCPSDIQKEVEMIKNIGVETIYYRNKEIHFKFPIIYPGKDAEGIDIQLVQEIVYSASSMNISFVANGKNQCTEHYTRIQDNWYLGNLYY